MKVTIEVEQETKAALEDMLDPDATTVDAVIHGMMDFTNQLVAGFSSRKAQLASAEARLKVAVEALKAIAEKDNLSSGAAWSWKTAREAIAKIREMK